MFVLDPDPYLRPSYRISPFRTEDISFNYLLPKDSYIDEYFDNRFKGNRNHYTINGREAINMALCHYQLQKDDFVTILTTTGNFYISSCVTNEIQKFCRWSRQIESRTKVILVNHEFGYPYSALNDLTKKGIPIIEDCAHSFFSKDKDNSIGNVGDFVIYSFPKMFPLQIGGLLVSNIKSEFSDSKLLRKPEKRYIKNVLSHHIRNIDEIIEKRLINYSYLSRAFEEFGLTERFNLINGTVPGVFMFQSVNLKLELPELKNHFNAHGVQCSVFYGEEAFFIPVHQALNEQDLLYFCEVMKSFIHKSEL